MSRFVTCLVVSFGFACPLNAQLAPYNPYATTPEDQAPIRADGKLNWPSFFKSQQIESKFQSYFAMGSCVGTKQSVNELLKNNKLNINQLAEGSVCGQSLGVNAGIVGLIDTAGQGIIVITHPAGVTRVRVSGKMPVTGLRPGMTVRLTTSVDEHGRGTELVDALEVITPTKDVTPQPVESGHLQTIIGIVTHVDGPKLRLKAVTGKVRNLNFVLSEHPTVDVNGSSVDLISAGDEITVKGHLLANQPSAGAEMVFADDIDVHKRDAPPVLTASKHADQSTNP